MPDWQIKKSDTILELTALDAALQAACQNRLFRLPALYLRLYSLYREQIASCAADRECKEIASLLGLAILLAHGLAQGPLQKEGEELAEYGNLSGGLNGRLGFRLGELHAVLQTVLPNVLNVEAGESPLNKLTKLAPTSLANCALLKQLPGFAAFDIRSAGNHFASPSLHQIYFCYWQHQPDNGLAGELPEWGFCLARMAQLQQSLARLLYSRLFARHALPPEFFTQSTQSTVLERPQLLRQTLGRMLARAAGQPCLPQSREQLHSLLQKLCDSRLLLIAGGPGSGKTTLLSSLLQILRMAEQEAEQMAKQGAAPHTAASLRKLELALCAPTARAAERMLQSLKDSQVAGELQAQTLHKLLGLGWSGAQLYRPAQMGSPNCGDPKSLQLLRLDLLVLDEVSMLDSEMAWRLFSRLHPQTRVILIGDPQQLPPVGLGTFWQELLASLSASVSVEAIGAGAGVADILIELRANHRSAMEIQQLAQKVLSGEDLSPLLENKKGAADSTVCWQPCYLPVPSVLSQPYSTPYPKPQREPQDLLAYLWQNWCGALHVSSVPQGDSLLAELERYFQWLQDYTILSPLQRGSGGARAINQMLFEYAKREREKQERQKTFIHERAFFHGCPIQITRNNYPMGLYNGDRGFCLKLNLEQGQELFYGVFAKKPTDLSLGQFGGRVGEAAAKLLEKYRLLPLAQIAHCELAFVQTIHKSQGSEYANVCVLLPEISNRASLTGNNCWSKPLLYTAITRAKQRLCFVGSLAALQALGDLEGKQSQPLSLLVSLIRSFGS